MKKFKLKRLKIIEQIAIVFFFAVVIPMAISGFVINNINQQSVRHQLRESAILVASMVSDEMDFLIRLNETTLSQIADSLEFLPSSQRNKFLKDIADKYPHSHEIFMLKTQDELNKVKTDAKEEEHAILSTQMKDGSFLVLTFNSNNVDTQLFKSLEDNKPFTSKNVKILKNTSIISLAMSILWILDLLFMIIIMKNTYVNYIIVMSFLSLLFFGVAIALYILAQLFNQATQYKEENDLTI